MIADVLPVFRASARRRRAPVLSTIALILGVVAAAYAAPAGSLAAAMLASGLISFGAACLAVDFGLVRPLRRLVEAQRKALDSLHTARRSDAEQLQTLEARYDALRVQSQAMRAELSTRASAEALNEVKQVLSTRASAQVLQQLSDAVETRATVAQLDAMQRILSTRASGEALGAVKDALATKASISAVTTLKDLVRESRGEIEAMKPRLARSASAAALGVVQRDVQNLYDHVKSIKADQNGKASAEAVLKLSDDVRRIFGRVTEIREELAGKASADALAAAKTLSKENADKFSARISALQAQTNSHHVHNRIISPADIETLIERWAKPLRLEIDETTIRYLADRVRALENRCEGRLATDLQTMVARSLAALSLDGEKIAIAEIGTLFGVCAGALYEFCANRFDAVSLTLIDPLEGYYDQSMEDLVTKVPVSRRILDKNLRLMHVPEEATEIIQGLSEDEDVLQKVENRVFDFLIIDGDHSYEGVKRDFENYVSLVRPGGLIVFDDYEVVAWPEIKRYVDEEIAMDRRVKILATGFRTALARRTD